MLCCQNKIVVKSCFLRFSPKIYIFIIMWRHEWIPHASRILKMYTFISFGSILYELWVHKESWYLWVNRVLNTGKDPLIWAITVSFVNFANLPQNIFQNQLPVYLKVYFPLHNAQLFVIHSAALLSICQNTKIATNKLHFIFSHISDMKTMKKYNDSQKAQWQKVKISINLWQFTIKFGKYIKSIHVLRTREDTFEAQRQWVLKFWHLERVKALECCPTVINF